MSSPLTTAENELAAAYERDGYIVAPSLFSREECSRLKEVGLQVLREHAAPGSSVYVGMAAADPLFYQLASDDRLVKILRLIMPDGVMFMSDKFVFKSGDRRRATPWHCDSSYWPNTRPKLSVWIPLDDVTAANGALKVIPGGHKQTWRHHQADPREFDKTIKDLAHDAPGEVICEMQAGSALIFSDNLPHASTENISGLDRYALISTYHAPAPDESFDLHFEARHVIIGRAE